VVRARSRAAATSPARNACGTIASASGARRASSSRGEGPSVPATFSHFPEFFLKRKIEMQNEIVPINRLVWIAHFALLILSIGIAVWFCILQLTGTFRWYDWLLVPAYIVCIVLALAIDHGQPEEAYTDNGDNDWPF
jgi:peptidoglycan/LPS O-acetylase OafA/YrhL